MFKQISEELAFGDEASVDQLRQVAGQGFRTVVDLCTLPEGKQIAEAQASEAGLELKLVPVSIQELDKSVFHAFEHTVDAAKGPVYVRCASGKRAALMAFLLKADRENWTEDEFMRQISQAGVDLFTPPALEQFAHEYFRHRKAVG